MANDKDRSEIDIDVIRWLKLMESRLRSLERVELPVAGSGGFAPNDAQYLTLATSTGLSNERVFTPVAPIVGTDGGAGAAYSLSVTGSALTRVNDTNVTLMLGGTPATSLLTAVSLTLGWAGQLSLARGGTGADLSATGGAGQYLKQASAGGAVTVGTIPASDIASGAALTRVDDTNVTLTLGGTPLSALLAAVSLTLGWTGQLAVTRGGTGLGSVAQGDLLYGSAANTLSALAKNTSATRYLSNTGASNNPAWAQVDLATGISGFGANVATFLATPSSANLAAAVTDETGSGSAVFATSPAITSPAISGTSSMKSNLGGTNEVEAIMRKTGLADNVATLFFSITTTNESGSSDGGAYVCEYTITATHQAVSGAGTAAVMKYRASFSRAMSGAGSGANTAVEDVFTGASVSTNAAVRDIASVTTTVAENTEYISEVSVTVDLTGSSISTAEVTAHVRVLYAGFITAPVIDIL